MKVFFFLISLIFMFVLAVPVFAHCPLCTAATGAAVGFSRTLGIDDVIVGAFIGAFIISTSLWIHNFLYKRHGRKNYIPYQALIIIIASIASTLVSFYYGKLFSGEPSFLGFFGYNRLLSGILIGIVLSATGSVLHDAAKAKNGNKVYFPFQGMVLMLGVVITGIVVLIATGLVI